MPPLRRLAIHVEEPSRGAFQWVLSEVDATASLVEVERAESHAKTYRQAMADGLRALQELVDDLDIGPRSQPDAERVISASASQEPMPADGHESPDDSVAVAPQAYSTPESTHKATAFGFGLPS